MKKRKVTVLSILLIAVLAFPVVASAMDRELSRYMSVKSELELTGGTAGESVTQLSNGTFDRTFSTAEEFWQSVPVVSVAAVMDNTTGSALYWSEKPYKNEEGNSEQVAVLKADAAHKWNENSCIIIKMQDLRGYIAGIQIEMGASPDGPRDYKFEYSLDGKNYYPLGAQGEQASITEPYNITYLYEDDISALRLERKYTKGTLKDEEGRNCEVRSFQDVYFKVSVASDYKVNGENGLYGSDKGEMAIRSVKFLQYDIVIDDPATTPYNVKAYKTSEDNITVSWKSGDSSEIYLKKGNGAYEKVRTITDSAITKCELTGLSPTATYKVKVRSYNKMSYDIFSSFSKPVTVNMKKQPILKNLSVNKTLTLKVGKSKELAVKLTDGTSKSFIKSIKYSVKNPNIATVKSGTIKGIKAGSTQVKTKVTLKSGLKKTFTTKVKVKKS